MSSPTRRRRGVMLSALAAVAALVATTLAALTSSATAETPDPAQGAQLPSSFEWESTGPLVAPQQTAPGRELVSIKDPSVVNVDGQYHVYATTADTDGGWSMTYFGGFSDWSQAGDAQQYHLSQTPIGGGYRAAPQVFYFEPDDQWYLVYQTGLPSFSTLDHPSQPETASAAQNFMSSYPSFVNENSDYVVDHWVTCDDVNCYLFYNNSNNVFFRSQTTVEEFPNGFDDTVVVMEDPGDNRYFEAINVYKVGDTGQYMMLIEGIGSDGKRYFNSWTADSLDAVGDEWTPLAADESNPFLRSNNVAFASGVEPWTEDFSHGELVRASNDQTLTIDPCNLQFLYQGKDPDAGGDYVLWPWKLGLVTQTNAGPDCDSGSEEPTDPTDPPVEGECSASIEIGNDWGSGWQGTVTVTAGEDSLSGWDLSWDWPAGQQISSSWNADLSQSGAAVTAADVGWNGQVAAGQTREVFGFVASGPAAAPEVDCAAA